MWAQPLVSRQRAGRRRRATLAATLPMMVLLVLSACSGGEPAPSPWPSPSPTVAPSRPGDGVGLAAFGIQNGPAAFALPRGSVPVRTVDQPDTVVVVLSAPDPGDVADYLRRALPESGFSVAQPDPSQPTFRFQGHGWTGSFTGSATSSAILLRPL